MICSNCKRGKWKEESGKRNETEGQTGKSIVMKRWIFASLLVMLSATAVSAQVDTIDISGNNKSDNYVTYSQAISLPAGKMVNVMMARYCYFSSKISGSGVLNLYAGGERSYLGTAKGAAWPVLTGYKGDIHIYPFKANAPDAGFWGVVLAHGGKSSSPENALDDAKSGKVNPSMANNKVTLHRDATMCCEANTSGAGFRIGELQTEEGSTLLGYMKNQRAAYYLLGGLNTDATLAGTIKPSDYRDDTSLSIVKEGTGTLRITGNQNYLSGALRVLEGRVMINNNRAEAEKKKLRGGLGARPNVNEPVAYVFSKGVLGGSGSIGGAVDNYGTIEPGDDAIDTLTLKNYVSLSKNANLILHPASVLRFKVASANSCDQLNVAGVLSYSNMCEDFSTSDAMPIIELKVEGNALEVGQEFTLLTAKSKSGDWQFKLKVPKKYTWKLEERTDNGYALVLVLTSLEDQDPDDPDNPDIPDPEDMMGPFYDDGIDDNTDNNTLRYYAEKNGKKIGVALCTYKGLQSDRDEAGRQFNMMVAENEMKMETLQPSQGTFSYGAADQLVTFAKNNNMTVRGHCLVWHTQQPTWLSSDGKKNDKNWSRQQALKIMKDHITNVMQHFKGKVVEWDVVNECLDDDQSGIRTNPKGYKLRESVWQRAIGDDYIDSAFVYAHRADPNAILYLNDYDVELQGKAKAVAFYNLAMRLKNSGIPIDGVGLQCHFSIGEVDSVKLESTIRRFGAANMKCIVTELDMGIPSTSAADLLEQARNYRVITDIVLNNDNCPNMLIWGIKDNDSWRTNSNPLLYTSGLGKKKAWYAVRSALRHRSLQATSITPSPFNSQLSTFISHPVFDLSGRQVNEESLRPGIYIRNGKKFIKN